MTFDLTARPAVLDLRASKIREVANAGLGRDDVLALLGISPVTAEEGR